MDLAPQGPPAQGLQESEGSGVVSCPVPWPVPGALHGGALPRFRISVITTQSPSWRWRKCRTSVWARQSPHYWKLLVSRTNPQKHWNELVFLVLLFSTKGSIEKQETVRGAWEQGLPLVTLLPVSDTQSLLLSRGRIALGWPIERPCSLSL